MKTWLITGTSSGLGKALAAAVLDRGDRVILAARRPEDVAELGAIYPETTLIQTLDVTNAEQVERTVSASVARFGAIDVLVNNAGYGYRAAVEEGDDAEVRRLFDTHVFGAVSLIKAVLPQMRARNSGTIVSVSSIGTQLTPAGSGYYVAAKAAIEALTGSLRAELLPLGIHAMTVEPGAFRTDFSGRSLSQSATALTDYAQTAGLRRKENDTSSGSQPGDPTKAALAILTAVDAGTPPPLLVLGPDAFSARKAAMDATAATLELWHETSVRTDLD